MIEKTEGTCYICYISKHLRDFFFFFFFFSTIQIVLLGEFTLKLKRASNEIIVHEIVTLFEECLGCVTFLPDEYKNRNQFNGGTIDVV